MNRVSSAAEEPVATISGDFPRRRVAARKVMNRRGEDYYIYVPSCLRQNPEIFVAVHGINRNSAEQAFRFSALAEDYGVIVLAPHFNQKIFPDYQRLGRKGRGRRADRALLRMIDEVAAQVPGFEGKVCLFGYSGGAQFAHRFAMAYPDRVRCAIIGASGWYTVPDVATPYPRGIRTPRKLKGVTFDPARFLRVPFHVVVGEKDTSRKSGFNRSARLDAEQGRTRLERATSWVEKVNELAKSLGIEPPATLEILPGAHHSFSRLARHHKLLEHVFTVAFDESPSGTVRPGEGRGDVETNM